MARQQLLAHERRSVEFIKNAVDSIGTELLTEGNRHIHIRRQASRIGNERYIVFLEGIVTVIVQIINNSSPFLAEQTLIEGYSWMQKGMNGIGDYDEGTEGDSYLFR